MITQRNIIPDVVYIDCLLYTSTYHFYVDDYRFEAIWKDPIKVLTSGVKALVEPNLSVYDTTPILSLIHIW